MNVDPRSEKNIATLHPKVQALARQLVLDAAAKGIVIRITSGTRTYAEQDALFAQGGVTRARGGYSNHNFGLALDVTIFKDEKPVWESPQYKTVGELGKILGFAWGGDWQSIVDEPHFELRPDWARQMSESEMLTELRRRHDAGVDVFGGAPHPIETFNKTRQRVGNRGQPPTDFLIALVQWGDAAPRDIFEVRADPRPPNEDIYTKIKPKLGPWRGERHRIAAMLETLRVLGGLEASWNQQEGKDTTNPSENDEETMSAGMFQISYNSRHNGKDLLDMLTARGIANGLAFQDRMKNDLTFAMEYCARLLRHTDEHNGPVKRGEILEWMHADSVAEFEALLA